jgi:hypothetical protein
MAPRPRDEELCARYRAIADAYDSVADRGDQPGVLKHLADHEIAEFALTGSVILCSLLSPMVRQGRIPGRRNMSKEAADHHRQASEHHKNAARHHDEAAKHYESGSHEKASHHAHAAHGHASHAREHGDHASRAHSKEHGSKT